MALKLNRQTVAVQSVWLKKTAIYDRMDFGQVTESSIYSRVIMDALIIIRDNLYNQRKPVLTEITINLPNGQYKIGVVYESMSSLEDMAANVKTAIPEQGLKILTSGGMLNGEFTNVCIPITEANRLDEEVNLIKEECKALHLYNKILLPVA